MRHWGGIIGMVAAASILIGCSAGDGQHAPGAQQQAVNGCPDQEVGAPVDAGVYAGQHYVVLYHAYTSSNPSVGTYLQFYDTSGGVPPFPCVQQFNVGTIVCNNSNVAIGVTYSDANQINITLPLSNVARTCRASTSSRNTQYVKFDFTLPADQ